MWRSAWPTFLPFAYSYATLNYKEYDFFLVKLMGKSPWDPPTEWKKEQSRRKKKLRRRLLDFEIGGNLDV